jgi:hypothetical protein
MPVLGRKAAACKENAANTVARPKAGLVIVLLSTSLNMHRCSLAGHYLKWINFRMYELEGNASLPSTRTR